MITLPAKVRLYIYKVLVAAGPLVLLAGWATQSELALWVGLAYTLLGSPVGALAAANVPTAAAPMPPDANGDFYGGLRGSPVTYTNVISPDNPAARVVDTPGQHAAPDA